MKRRPFAFVAFALIIYSFGASNAGSTEAAWARLATGGYTVFLTHALAPGAGDPPHFELDDCTTQRNLSDRGRQQALRRGVRFAARAVSISRVYSSRWCRTIDTANAAFRVDPELLEALDLVEDDPEALAAQSKEIIEIIRQFRGPGNQVMVTHPENVEALTGIMPREGEAVIVAPSRKGGSEDAPDLDVVARLLLD
ncbi:MAG: histidine phosphatase family protein [Hyphomicrobiales bacterium]|nr:histidine phosphatase family protein [Hyphomicrobiales bacterium]MCP5001621.1 histidine phosphatase family protein [Hyphomicrobiales bacterium]